MLLPTHISMGRYLMEVVDVGDSKMFIKGIRDPDIFKRRFGWVHTYDKTMIYVKRALHALNHPKSSIAERSYNTGIIVHFITDYMCKYHKNISLFKKTISHIAYEIMMVAEWKLCDKGHITEDILDQVQYYKGMDLDDISIFDFIDRYVKDTYEHLIEPSYHDDIFHSIFLSFLVVHLIKYKNKNSLFIN